MTYAGMILLAISGLLGLFLLVMAFKSSIKDGLLSMIIPFYLLYFAFAKFTSPKKSAIVGGWLGAAVIGTVLMTIGAVSAAQDAAENFTMGDLEQAIEAAEVREAGEAAPEGAN